MEQVKTKLILFIFSQIIIVTIVFLSNKELGLTPYINVSFFVGGIIVFIGLLIYVVSNGFFDIFTMSMRKVFTTKRNLEVVESMRSPSELLDFSYRPFFQLGGSILLFMAMALIIYYM